MMPAPTSAWLTRPLRPSSGTHEIMRITFEVQNGIVHSERQHEADRGAPDLEGQVIGDREADHQGEQPDDEAELQRRQVGSERRAEVWQSDGCSRRKIAVVVDDEGRLDGIAGVAPEADDESDDERQNEEEEEDDGQGGRLPVGSPARVGASSPACRIGW